MDDDVAVLRHGEFAVYIIICLSLERDKDLEIHAVSPYLLCDTRSAGTKAERGRRLRKGRDVEVAYYLHL